MLPASAHRITQFVWNIFFALEPIFLSRQQSSFTPQEHSSAYIIGQLHRHHALHAHHVLLVEVDHLRHAGELAARIAITPTSSTDTSYQFDKINMTLFMTDTFTFTMMRATNSLRSPILNVPVTERPMATLPGSPLTL